MQTYYVIPVVGNQGYNWSIRVTVLLPQLITLNRQLLISYVLCVHHSLNEANPDSHVLIVYDKHSFIPHYRHYMHEQRSIVYLAQSSF